MIQCYKIKIKKSLHVICVLPNSKGLVGINLIWMEGAGFIDSNKTTKASAFLCWSKTSWSQAELLNVKMFTLMKCLVAKIYTKSARIFDKIVCAKKNCNR